MSKFDLGAFLAPDGASVSESDTMREIPVEDILDNPRNFYPRPDNAALAALMESIEANGLLEPPTVVPAEDGKYRLISGHSRMTALRELAASDDKAVAERFARIPCRVLPPMTPAHEECAVIEANRQRIKTPALLAQEAERLTEMYVKRREEGEELPGRIRDRVAEAMQVSKTKLANLSAIRNGLKVPGIKRKWEDGDIPEAAALEIARMDDETQYRLLDCMIEQHRPYTIGNVQAFLKSREAAAKKAEDEQFSELLFRYRASFSSPLRVCEDREDGIFTLKERFKYSGCGSSKGGFEGSPKGLTLYGTDKQRIFRPWAAVYDMLAAMALQDGPVEAEDPAPSAAGKKGETRPVIGVDLADGPDCTVQSAVWFPSSVEPAEGAHIVYIDDCGIADEGIYRDSLIDNGNGSDWCDVELWTLYPKLTGGAE